MRVGKVVHHKRGETEAPQSYTVMDDVVSKKPHLIGMVNSS